MPTYTFKLCDGTSGIEDGTGVRLPNRRRALRYARDVIHELMNRREAKTRSWRLDVFENHRERVFAIPFASVDSSLDHLNTSLRHMVESFCERRLAFAEAAYDAAATLQESRALVARSRGKPYVAARFGVRTIRDR